MANYTVKSGDTLTGIAKSLGLSNYNQLSGYNTANPNLITPGMVLTYNSPTSTPTTTSPAATATSAPNAGTSVQEGVTEATNAFQPVINAQNALSEQQFGTLKQNINTQLGQSIEGVSSTLASKGLGRSGEVGWDTAQLEDTAQQQLGEANLQETLTDAQNAATNYQNIFSSASTVETNAFSEWYQKQGLDQSLFSSLPTAWNTLLTLPQNIDEQTYNSLASIFNQITG